jgi:hypothetical protein
LIKKKSLPIFCRQGGDFRVGFSGGVGAREKSGEAMQNSVLVQWFRGARRRSGLGAA